MSLRLDFVNRKTAMYACQRWHYSHALSSSKNVYIGVWEDSRFIGVVVFGIGAGNATNGGKYGLARAFEVAELTRVALTDHQTPVTRIVAIALRMIKKNSPGLRLIISFADPNHGHAGKIYQAGNWIYTGTSSRADPLVLSRGQWVHRRTAGSRGSTAGLTSKKMLPKHRYLYPLDDEIRERVLPLAQPYPDKPASVG